MLNDFRYFQYCLSQKTAVNVMTVMMYWCKNLYQFCSCSSCSTGLNSAQL